MNTQAPIKVTLIGMEDRSQKILTRIITAADVPSCVMTDETAADIAVVDLDGDFSQDELLAIHQQLDMPVIALSETEVHAPNVLWVVKPIQSRPLLQAIWKLGRQRQQRALRRRRQALLAGSARVQREVTQQLRSKPVARTSGIAAKSGPQLREAMLCGVEREEAYLAPKLPAGLFYDPGVHLQSIVQGAIDEVKRRGRPMIIRGLGRDITVFQHGEFVATELTAFQLRELSKSQFDRKLVVFLFARESTLDMDRLHQQAERRDEFMWKLALWCARGRLPRGTSLDKPVSIVAWPNLTRLALFPHAVQLAALWHRQAISIRATAILLDLSYKYVFSFYAACLQLGLIREHSRPENFHLQAAGSRASRGFLGRVLGYLNRRVRGSNAS